MRTTWPISTGTDYVDSQPLSEFPNWKSWLTAHEADVKEHSAAIVLQTSTPITTTWRCNGEPHSVVTYWNGTESVDEWIDRHFKAVEAAMENCPPS